MRGDSLVLGQIVIPISLVVKKGNQILLGLHPTSLASERLGISYNILDTKDNPDKTRTDPPTTGMHQDSRINIFILFMRIKIWETVKCESN